MNIPTDRLISTIGSLLADKNVCMTIKIDDQDVRIHIIPLKEENRFLIRVVDTKTGKLISQTHMTSSTFPKSWMTFSASRIDNDIEHSRARYTSNSKYIVYDVVRSDRPSESYRSRHSFASRLIQNIHKRIINMEMTILFEYNSIPIGFLKWFAERVANPDRGCMDPNMLPSTSTYAERDLMCYVIHHNGRGIVLHPDGGASTVWDGPNIFHIPFPKMAKLNLLRLHSLPSIHCHRSIVQYNEFRREMHQLVFTHMRKKRSSMQLNVVEVCSDDTSVLPSYDILLADHSVEIKTLRVETSSDTTWASERAGERFPSSNHSVISGLVQTRVSFPSENVDFTTNRRLDDTDRDLLLLMSPGRTDYDETFVANVRKRLNNDGVCVVMFIEADDIDTYDSVDFNREMRTISRLDYSKSGKKCPKMFVGQVDSVGVEQSMYGVSTQRKQEELFVNSGFDLVVGLQSELNRARQALADNTRFWYGDPYGKYRIIVVQKRHRRFRPIENLLLCDDMRGEIYGWCEDDDIENLRMAFPMIRHLPTYIPIDATGGGSDLDFDDESSETSC